MNAYREQAEMPDYSEKVYKEKTSMTEKFEKFTETYIGMITIIFALLFLVFSFVFSIIYFRNRYCAADLEKNPGTCSSCAVEMGRAPCSCYSELPMRDVPFKCLSEKIINDSKK